ncbi:hypothetical protein ACEQPO_29330 [Bacillus sp. SL00103]
MNFQEKRYGRRRGGGATRLPHSFAVTAFFMEMRQVFVAPDVSSL